MSSSSGAEFSPIDKKKSIYVRLFLYFVIFLFIILQLIVVSAMAQTAPIYGNMEKLICGDEIGIKEINSKCLLLFESYEGSPKYGILYDSKTFMFNKETIEGKRGYVDRSYFELLNSGRLLYQLQSMDDSYFYVIATDDGSSSITIVYLPPTP